MASVATGDLNGYFKASDFHTLLQAFFRAMPSYNLLGS